VRSRRALPRRVALAVKSFADFVTITYREFAADRLMLRAMSLAYGTMLALVPLLVIIFSVFKLLGGGHWFNHVVRPELMNYLAPGVEPMVSDKLSHLIDTFAAKTIGGVGLVLLLLGVHGIFTAVEMTFNLIWGGAPRGKMLVRVPLYWGLLILIPILIAGSLAVTTYLSALPVAGHTDILDLVVRHIVPGLMVALSMFLLYRFLPTAPVQWRSAAIGALLAGAAYEIMKHLFLIYVRKLVKYNVLYGSLAIVPMLMIWINLSWIVTLIGIEVAYVHQHFLQLKRDNKRIPLSRLQQDALAYRILREAAKGWQANTPWVAVGRLAELWGVPHAASTEVVKLLERGRIIVRRGEAGDLISLARSPQELKMDVIDQALAVEAGEVWPWPDESDWQQIKTWLQSRERRGGASDASLAEIPYELPEDLRRSRIQPRRNADCESPEILQRSKPTEN
jgi:membrane protein